MTREEAEKIAKVFAEVDGGCCVCVRGACRDANKLNLGWFWAPIEDYEPIMVCDKYEDLPEWFRKTDYD